MYQSPFDDFMDTYSIERFLKEAQNKSWLDLVIYAEEENRRLKQLNITPKHVLFSQKDRVEYYRRFVGEFCFLIGQCIRPAGMPDDQFKRTRPLIEALVDSGQLKPEALAMYQ